MQQPDDPEGWQLPRSPAIQEVADALSALLGGGGPDSVRAPAWVEEFMIAMITSWIQRELGEGAPPLADIEAMARSDQAILPLEWSKRWCKLMFVLGRLATEHRWDSALVSTKEE